MKKMPTIFKLLYPELAGRKTRIVTDQPNMEQCAWLFNAKPGEVEAKQKFDGTSCCCICSVWHKRLTLKKGRTPPSDFIRVDFDPVTGKYYGWATLEDSDKWHQEAINNLGPDHALLRDVDTYELCGPKIQSNPEKLTQHTLIPHYGEPFLQNVPLHPAALREWFQANYMEGVVFYGPNMEMAKIKRVDLGLDWPEK